MDELSMKPTQLTVVSIVLAALLSGLAASGITLVVQNHLSQRDAKREVLVRLAGFRYLLAPHRLPFGTRRTVSLAE